MGIVLWGIFSWIMKGIIILMVLTIVAFLCKFLWLMATNSGRKWYYYDPSKPWKGGYWTPLLPGTPPYNEYKWNPETCRFEHKETGEPLHEWQKPVIRQKVTKPHEKRRREKRRRPEWMRFLFKETPATLLEKRRRRKWSDERGQGES